MANGTKEVLASPTRRGVVDTGSQGTEVFPIEAFKFDPPSESNPDISLQSPWRFNAGNSFADTAANLASANPVLPKGWIAYETDTKLFKIGDGTTAFNSLMYQWQKVLEVAWTFPTIGAVTTPPTIGTKTFAGSKRRSGNRLDLSFTLNQTAGGSTGTGIYLIPVPDSLALDTSNLIFDALSTFNGTPLGHGFAYSSAGPAAGIISVRAKDANNLVLVIETSAATNYWGSASFAANATTLNIGFEASLPISGWNV